MINGEEVVLKGSDPTVINPIPGTLHISWPLKSLDGTLVMDMDEQQIKMKIEGNGSYNWFLDLTTKYNVNLPFLNISSSQINCEFEGMKYFITTKKGVFSQPDNGVAFRITPQKNTVILNLTGSHSEERICQK